MAGMLREPIPGMNELAHTHEPAQLIPVVFTSMQNPDFAAKRTRW
jgi:hypothetical protein